MAAGPDNALDHVVVVMFENRSFDNLLGRLYEPGEVASFEGVIGKDLSNPVPDWAEHRPDDGIVRYRVAPDMNRPNPDSGEELPHINTQLFGILDDENLGRLQPEESFNEPREGQAPTMDGFVCDFISMLMVELGRQPTLRRVRPDHDRLHAGADAGPVGTSPRLRDLRSLVLRRADLYVPQPLLLSRRPVLRLRGQHVAAGLVPRQQRCRNLVRPPRCGRPELEGLLRPTLALLADRDHPRPATCRPVRDELLLDRSVPRGRRERPAAHVLVHRAADHRLEPQRHAPAVWRPPGRPCGAEGRGGAEDLHFDPPSSLIGGEDLLARIYNAIRDSSSPTGSNHLNTTLLVTFDEHGGTYDHVPPPAAVPPDGKGAPGQMGFTFSSGVRIPTLAISAWIPERTVINAEHRATSLLATMRER